MPRSSTQVRRSRTRSGCLTCRDRHMKCDEQQPVCKNCIKSKRKCYRGVRLNFTQYTIYKPENRSILPTFPRHFQFRFLDQSITTASLYENGRRHYEPYLNLHTSELLREAEFMFQEEMYLIHSIPAHEQISGRSSVAPETLNHVVSNHLHQNVDNHEVGSQIMHQDQFQYNQFTRPIQGRVGDWTHPQLELEQPAATGSILLLVSRIADSVTGNTAEVEILDQDVEVSDLLEYYQSPSFEITPTFPEFMDSLSAIDSKVQSFIEIIQDQKYYWILDLFNEISLWQQIIPYYCLKAVEDKAGSGLNSFRSFLMDCLLCCSIDSVIFDESLLEQQLKLWKTSQLEEIPNDNFIKVTISVALILLGIYLRHQNRKYMAKDEADLFPLEQSRDIFFQQIQLFDELMSKVNLDQYLTTSTPPPLLLISSFHSILILKFLLRQENFSSVGLNQFEIKFLQAPHNFEIRQFKKNNHLNERSKYENLGAPSSRSTSRSSASQLSLNAMGDSSSSISNMSSNTKRFPNSDNNSKSAAIQATNNFTSAFKSEAYKLRQVMWKLIKLDHSCRFNDYTTFGIAESLENVEANKEGEVLGDRKEEALIFTNDRGIALSLLQEYLKLLASPKKENIEEVTSEKLTKVFSTIHNSFTSSELKFKWKSHFNWVLNGAN